MSRTAIFCEDKYGEPFLKKLTNLLKDIGLIDNTKGFDILKFYGACNSKLEHQLRVKSINSDNFIILVDSDGHDKTIIRQRVKQHVPPGLVRITQIIVFDYEIEDWLCCGMGIQITGRTAAIMKKEFNYEKYQLPSYVPKLDLKRLQDCSTFKEFIDSL
jgi:hypothetical protein